MNSLTGTTFLALLGIFYISNFLFYVQFDQFDEAKGSINGSCII